MERSKGHCAQICITEAVVPTRERKVTNSSEICLKERNVTVEWLELFCSLGSNLGPEAGCTDRDISFSSFLPCKFWDGTLKQVTTASLNIRRHS